MKFLITLLVLGFAPALLNAQKVVEKHFNVSPNGSVNLNIQIADSITILTWNKKEAYLKATVNVNDNKNNDDYKWNFDETGGNMNVEAKFQYENRKSNNCDCNNKAEIICVVYVPENINVAVQTINGNITITGQTAEIKAKSISGFVDMSVSPQRAAKVRLNTISGTMYSDLDLYDKGNMKRVGGNAISSNLNGGGSNSIHLETISGDIYFHKSS